MSQSLSGDIRARFAQVDQTITEAAARSGRRRQDVILVAVTKYATMDQIRSVVELGQRDLGESRAQQLSQRAAQLDELLQRRRSMSKVAPRQEQQIPSEIRWHMIGHLQRNKVKTVVPLVKLIHSIDSFRLVEELHGYATKHDAEIDLLIQVNASGEESKFGVAPAAISHLADQVATMVNLRLRGLMTMAPYDADTEKARPVFARTRELFEEVRTRSSLGSEFNILSMGMSHDYAVAIEEGANLVRIGSALFGDDGPADHDEDEPE